MNEEPIKCCTKCGKVKPITEFSKKETAKDGYRNRCKACIREEYKIYHATHREEEREFRRRYKTTCPEKVKEAKRRYRETHREQLIEANRRYKVINQMEIKKRNKKYQHAHPEKARERQRKYYAAHPEKAKEFNRNHRAKKYVAIGKGITWEEWENICEKYDNQCLACGKAGELTIDHIVPLSRGGVHDGSNIQPLCASCNAKKGKKTMDYRHNFELQKASKFHLTSAPTSV
uniref:Putative homing endonuclease n=1 Tax=viral metagenome TaxID=1070528 RepID=A0A6H1ZEI5_9ZZZZ